jgi:hypothetical protein
MNRNKLSLDIHHLGVPSGVPKMNSMLVVHSTQTVHPTVAEIHYLQTDWNKLSVDPRHLGVPLGVPKMISKPMVHSPQTMHLFCVETRTISKQTETSFHLTNVTYKYHRVCLKRFPCPWYIWRKPYTYLAPRLTLSPNRPKWTST